MIPITLSNPFHRRTEAVAVGECHNLSRDLSSKRSRPEGSLKCYPLRAKLPGYLLKPEKYKKAYSR